MTPTVPAPAEPREWHAGVRYLPGVDFNVRVSEHASSKYGLDVFWDRNGPRLYVGIFNKPFWVDVFDTASLQLLATVSVPLNPFGITVSPNGRQLYVANWGDYSNIIPIAGHSVQVFDTRTLKLLGVVPVGDYPSAIAFGPNGRYAYVVNNSQPGTVSVVRTRDRQVTDTVNVGVCPSSPGASSSRRGLAPSAAGLTVITPFCESNSILVCTATM